MQSKRNPIAARRRAIGTIALTIPRRNADQDRSLRGSPLEMASWLFAKAVGKSIAIPITSPVDRISGPRTISTPGNFANGNTASLTET